jgi:DNA-binding response OmpR family regulator
MVVRGEKRLLIVDDDEDLLLLLKDTFEAEGFNVRTLRDGKQVMRYVQQNGLPHLALIDLKLPRMHGFELSDKLKALGDVPIVFISTEGQTDTVVRGLKDYAEDYVTKPFEVPVLVARVHRVLSRIVDFEYTQPPVVQVDNQLSVDFGKSRLIIGDRTETLTPTEATLLHILMRNAGSVVTSDTLIARVWPREEVYEETLRVHMHRLRRKIEPDFRHPQYIKTERGVGYRFVAISPSPPELSRR